MNSSEKSQGDEQPTQQEMPPAKRMRRQEPEDKGRDEQDERQSWGQAHQFAVKEEFWDEGIKAMRGALDANISAFAGKAADLCNETVGNTFAERLRLLVRNAVKAELVHYIEREERSRHMRPRYD